MIDGKLIHKSLKKMPYSGSYHGMRYYLTVEDNVLKTYVYPEPFCFEKTPEEQKKADEMAKQAAFKAALAAATHPNRHFIR